MQIMKKRSRSDVSRRAWRILRLALLWARKGGIKKGFMLDLSHYVKTLGQSKKGNGALQYGDRQLSFGATPIIHVRMHRPNSMRFRLPHIPCINPHVDCSDMFDFDEESDRYSCCEAKKSFLIGNGEEEYEYDIDQIKCEEEDMGIDLKAQEFIDNFYEQLKLQRQLNTRRKRD